MTTAPTAEGRMPDDLSRWVARLTAALDVEPAAVDIAAVLALAKETAHGVARPAAPVSAFVVGLAAGRAGGSPADIERAMTATRELLLTAELGSEADA